MAARCKRVNGVGVTTRDHNDLRRGDLVILVKETGHRGVGVGTIATVASSYPARGDARIMIHSDREQVTVKNSVVRRIVPVGELDLRDSVSEILPNNVGVIPAGSLPCESTYAVLHEAYQSRVIGVRFSGRRSPTVEYAYLADGITCEIAEGDIVMTPTGPGIVTSARYSGSYSGPLRSIISVYKKCDEDYSEIFW